MVYSFLLPEVEKQALREKGTPFTGTESHVLLSSPAPRDTFY